MVRAMGVMTRGVATADDRWPTGDDGNERQRREMTDDDGDKQRQLMATAADDDGDG